MVPHCSEKMTLALHCCLAFAPISTFRISFAGFPWAVDQCVVSTRWSFSTYHRENLCLLIPRLCFVIHFVVFRSLLLSEDCSCLLFWLPRRFYSVYHVVQFSDFPKIVFFPNSFPVWVLFCSFSFHFLPEGFIFYYSSCPDTSALSVSVCWFLVLRLFASWTLSHFRSTWLLFWLTLLLSFFSVIPLGLGASVVCVIFLSFFAEFYFNRHFWLQMLWSQFFASFSSLRLHFLLFCLHRHFWILGVVRNSVTGNCFTKSFYITPVFW